MRPLLATLALTTALTAPSLAGATEVTLKTQLRNYGGKPAFLAYYVTDQTGAYVGTLWMAASKARYIPDLTDWYRYSGGDMNEISGITGASVGSGRTLTVTLDLADTLFDAGYTLHIDAAVEHYPASPSEIVLPLTREGASKPVSGRGYIESFSYAM
ncbi:DUF2271 domain-containing protein [Frigidibacter sp. ROC022]|uniref:DUF2271 domain-containing protein n=1 Tax=Frigidibacter sp. ROC022 TaxID=2971796 RepID=UPI00215A34FD|nr:DUF2271 domain-containing protein [Frigidibacter sp. ROC022]MCR8725376.1 DUF2271 domain-containing protein [Frigidibacter sp. ROC022]